MDEDKETDELSQLLNHFLLIKSDTQYSFSAKMKSIDSEATCNADVPQLSTANVGFDAVSFVGRRRRFGGAYCLHLQDEVIQQKQALKSALVLSVHEPCNRTSCYRLKCCERSVSFRSSTRLSEQSLHRNPVAVNVGSVSQCDFYLLFRQIVLFLTGLLFLIPLILKTCVLFDCVWSSHADNFPVFGLYTVVVVRGIIHDVFQRGKEH